MREKRINYRIMLLLYQMIQCWEIDYSGARDTEAFVVKSFEVEMLEKHPVFGNKRKLYSQCLWNHKQTRRSPFGKKLKCLCWFGDLGHEISRRNNSFDEKGFHLISAENRNKSRAGIRCFGNNDACRFEVVDVSLHFRCAAAAYLARLTKLILPWIQVGYRNESQPSIPTISD